MREILIDQLERAASRVVSHYLATTNNGNAPYDELTATEYASLTGYARVFFLEVGRPCLALTLLDNPKMKELIGELPNGKAFPQKQQRALKKNAWDTLQDNDEQYSTISLYPLLKEWIFPSAWKSFVHKQN